MTLEELMRILEALLLTTLEPLSLRDLLKVFPEAEKPSLEDMKEALASLQEVYRDRGICLVEVASGFRFQVSPIVRAYVAKHAKPLRFSRALMETIAIIAYRQPITRAEIEAIRGVALGSSLIKTLEELGWIQSVGHREVPGKPTLYATTKAFLDYLGLQRLDALPSLAPLSEEGVEDVEHPSLIEAE